MFTSSTTEAVAEAEIIFMAVGTPPLPNGEPDLTYLKAAAEEVARAMTGYRLIVNKSTVPIGSHRIVADWMAPYTKHAFDVVSNPEFLKEGTAVDDFLKPDRVVIGTESEKCFERMAELYSPFVRQGNPIIRMDPVSAEITKYACNAFLATRISFMNELSVLCEKVNGDIEQVRKGMTTDVRIGKHFLYAGVGYGGSCFPKDVQALMATGRRNDIPLGIISAAEEANARQKRRLSAKVRAHYGSQGLANKTFALWGLAFKPNTDDMREAPSLTVIKELTEEGARIRAFDPVATDNARKMVDEIKSASGKVQYCDSVYDTLEGADALLIVTEWNEFRHPDFEKIKGLLRTPLIFDGRNLFQPDQMRDRGFKYYGIGRNPA